MHSVMIVVFRIDLDASAIADEDVWLHFGIVCHVLLSRVILIT